MANIFSLMDLKTTIGKLRVCYITEVSEKGNSTYPLKPSKGDSLECSVCACPTNSNNGTILANTGSFSIIGKSGTEYPVNSTNNQLRLKIGSNDEILLWKAVTNYYAIPILSYNMGANVFGFTTWTIYNSNVPRNYEITITQVSNGKPGYTVITYNEYSGTITFHNYDGSTDAIGRVLKDIISGATPVSSDPYEGGGESGTGGGTGNLDGTGDDIDIPGLPTLSAVDTGFITLFNPSAGELRNLANYMWGDLFDVGTWKKIFADPMDAILGLSIVPVAVPNGGSSAVTVGNISTGISMNKAAAQYVSVDCGTLNVNEYWGAYLDYDPYTKAEIYLPYIGTHPLAVDDIMNKSVHVVYHIDILSGACCAYVKCGGSVLYSFVGQCSCSIPITGNDWTNVVNGALSIAASIGTMVATGGATAPMAAATIASTAVNSMKPSVEKSGSMGGMGGMLGVQTPYLILTRPRQALPARQNTFMGYPSFITMSLGDCSGYTEIESVHLENIPATEQEISEIENLLKGGVIL